MSHILNLPPMPVYVDNTFIYKDRPGFTLARLATIKSIVGEVFRFEVFIPEFGALYDKLPVHSLRWKILECQGSRENPKVHHLTIYPLHFLQLWNCIDHDIEIIEKSILNKCRTRVYLKDKSFAYGKYLWTIDFADSTNLPFSSADDPEEHKSCNFIALDNGQIAIQPNNRCQFLDQSLVPANPKIPQFKVATTRYSCEDSQKWTPGEGWTYDG